MTSSHEPSYRHFADTRWSMVVRLGTGQTRDAGSALIALCVRYWYPVYAYVRRCGHAPAIAQNLTGSFLQHLFQDFRDGAQLHAQGQFRRYLLERLNVFLASDCRTRAATKPLPNWRHRRRIWSSATCATTPERNRPNRSTSAALPWKSYRVHLQICARRRAKPDIWICTKRWSPV